MKKIANVSMYNNMEEISIMDDQDSLYLLLNGFMYPLSYQTTALYGGDACHPEKEIQIYFSDVYIRLKRSSILNVHFRTDKKLTWLVHVIIKYAKQYLRARRSTTLYTSYTPLHYTILYTPVLLLYTYTKDLARIVTKSINRKRIRKKAPMCQAVTAAVVKVRVNKLRSWLMY